MSLATTCIDILSRPTTHLLRTFKRQRRSITSSAEKSLPPWLSKHGGPQKGDKIVVAMSGGIDSSLTLALLHQASKEHNLDFQLSSIFMRNWNPEQSEDSLSSTSVPSNPSSSSMPSQTSIPIPSQTKNQPPPSCAWEKDWEHVQLVSSQFNVPTQMIDLSKDYWMDVFEPAVLSWSKGGTPNPDVGCNREIKFGKLMERALGVGVGKGTGKGFLATGHYARTDHLPPNSPLLPPNNNSSSSSSSTSHTRLLKPLDPLKSQTFFLSHIPHSSLCHSLFPLSHLHKSQVRSLAAQIPLPKEILARDESSGICFIGERAKQGRFGEFISQYTPTTTSFGKIVDHVSGEVIGEHQGLWYFTIGQKVNLPRLPSPMNRALGKNGGQHGRNEWKEGEGRFTVRIGGGARYVVAKEGDGNVLRVVEGSDHPSLYATSITTSPFTWIWESHQLQPPPEVDSEEGLRAFVQVRHRSEAVEVIVRRVGGSSNSSGSDGDLDLDQGKEDNQPNISRKPSLSHSSLSQTQTQTHTQTLILTPTTPNSLKAISPGQSLALYLETEKGNGFWEWCVGGGEIESVEIRDDY